MHVPGQLRVVGKNGVVADLAVMRQVHISHDPVVIAHARHTCIARRTYVEGAKLADGIAITNDKLAGLASIFLVLGNGAQRVELEDTVITTNGGVAFNDAVRANGGACTHLHVRANDRVRTYTDGTVQFSL